MNRRHHCGGRSGGTAAPAIKLDGPDGCGNNEVSQRDGDGGGGNEGGGVQRMQQRRPPTPTGRRTPPLPGEREPSSI